MSDNWTPCEPGWEQIPDPLATVWFHAETGVALVQEDPDSGFSGVHVMRDYVHDDGMGFYSSRQQTADWDAALAVAKGGN